MRSNWRRLVLNFVILSGGEASSKGLAFIVFAHLGRVLGPAAYGRIEFALAVTLSLGLLAEGGLGLYGAREIAKHKEDALRLTGHLVVLRCALAFVAFVLLLFVARLSGADQRTVLLLYGLTLVAGIPVVPWVFQALEQMHWIALSSVLRWAVFAAIVLLSGVTVSRIWLVPIADVVAVATVAALNIALLKRHFGDLRMPFDRQFALSLMRQAFPIGLTQIMWGLKVYVPTIMLGLLVGGSVVGWFGAAHRIVIALHTFVWMYFFSLYPSLSRSAQEGPDALRQLLRRSLQVTSIAAVAVGIVGTVAARPLLTLVYGPQYADAVAPFQILIWFVVFSLIGSHYMYALIASGRQWLELRSAVAGASVNVLVSYVCIPSFGVIGAAIGLVLAEATVWTLNYYAVRRHVIAVPVGAYPFNARLISERGRS